MKKIALLLAFFAIGLQVLMAQTKEISGKVTSVDDGGGIPGVSVSVKGTSLGTITDMDGMFRLKVPQDSKTLVFSFVGMQTQEVAIGSQTKINVKLMSENIAVDEVVVTALGIAKSEKTLGYASSTVKSDQLDMAKSGSVMGGLTSKVAGVQISGAGSTGTSQKVLIRGISSLNSNNPLYIVDGVPIDNSRNGNNAADFGNGANDINSEDVESVTILKGASATALYGSRASAGVVMITTKKAKVESLTITYDGTFSASNVLRVMQTQNLFGQGWGTWDRAENGSWGARLDGTTHEWGSEMLETPMTKPYSYVKNNLRDFYQTGFEKNNSVTLRYGTENVGVVASYGNLNSNGILPNDGDTYDRNTFSLRGFAKVKKFSMDMSMNYVRKDIRRTDGMDMELLQHGVDVSFSDQKDYNDVRYNTDNYYTWYAQNPYWMIDNNYYKYQDDRVYGKIEMSYELMKGLKATGRLGGDFSNQRRDNVDAKLTYSDGSYSQEGGKSEELGYYSKYSYNRSQIDATALLVADYKIGDLSIGGTAGWNLNQRIYNYNGGYVQGLDIPGWYNLLNTTSSATSDTYNSSRRLIGAFAQAELGYKNTWYLNLSARNDWSSTLPSNDNSFFYGGVNTSVILTELFPTLKAYKVDYLKLRAAVGQTGNDADVYKTKNWFTPLDPAIYTYNYTKLPIGGVSGLTENNTMASQILKPEMTTEYELGISGNFFNQRVSIDLAYYNKQTKDQIISAALAPETGYTRETRNVGKLENQGVEAVLTVTPVRTKNWKWDVGGTFSKNNSKVKELWDGLQEYTYTSWRGIEYILKVGGPIGVFRLPSVATVKDQSSPFYGYRIVSNNGFLTASSTDKDIVGASQPKFTVGFNTSLKYKNFTFSAVADWRKGGYMVSNTSYISHFNGNSTQTVFNERNSFIYPHSVKVVAGNYVENNIMVRSDQMSYAQGNYSYSPTALREFILPKDYFKLREVALSYDFPSKMFENTPIKKLSLSIVGRNLLLFTPKENNYVDPESSNLGNDLLSEFGETTGTSSTRSFGASIKVIF